MTGHHGRSHGLTAGEPAGARQARGGSAPDRVQAGTRRLRPWRALLVGLAALAGHWAAGQRG
jgi:hypothetical protein